MLDKITQIDGNLLIQFQHLVIHDSWTPIVKVITHVGDWGICWFVFAILMMCFKKTRKFGLLTLIAIALSFAVNSLVIKDLVARVRPYDTFQGVQLLINRQPDLSFPSGHTSNAFAGAVSMYLYLPKKIGIPAVILAVLVAFSRLYVGVHYPTDVLGGAIIGTLAAWLVYKIYYARQDALQPPKH